MVLRYRLGSWLAKILPNRLVSFLGEGIARVYSFFPTQKRELVEKNLKRVTQKTPTKNQIRQAFVSYAKYYVDASHLPYLSEDAIDKKFRTHGYENVELALSGGKGVILALPHMGSWEWAGAWLSRVRGVKATAIVEPLGSPELLKWVTAHRKKIGIDIFPIGQTAGTELIKALNQNQVVCLLCDRYISGSGMEVEFFNEKTTLPIGPAALAIRTGAPIIPAAIYLKDRVNCATVKPALDVSRKDRFRKDVERITIQLTKELENLIALAPEQWHLMSPNWPSDTQGNK